MEWFFNRQTQSQWNAAGLGFLTARCRSGTAASDDSGSLTARVCSFTLYMEIGLLVLQQCLMEFGFLTTRPNPNGMQLGLVS